MARGLNKVLLIGNLGADPEMRSTAGGDPVATFSVATNRTWRTQDGRTEEQTEWHRIVAFRQLAEICGKYLTKGSKVYLEGRLQTRSWDDAKTGQKRYMTEVVADQMIMLDSRGGGDFDARVAAPDAGSDVDRDVDWPDADDQDDDLPF